MPDAARRLHLSGHVQGVGYRPFVYRLAHELGVRGWVKNANGAVEIFAEGPEAVLAAFARGLVERAPAIARPRLVLDEPAPVEGHAAFVIRPSGGDAEPDIHVPPDYFTCDDCLDELRDPADRRYGYAFINCTQCGPRYTLITALPYDRPNTAMAGFPLCPDCLKEYEDPLNRRFHAEPVACPVCGPHLGFVVTGGEGDGGGGVAIDAAVAPTLSPALPPQGGGGEAEGVDRAAHGDAAAIPTTSSPPPSWGRGGGEGDDGVAIAAVAPTLSPTLPSQGGGSERFGDDVALDCAVAALRAGKIVAVKGVGGYHLMCDAGSDVAVAELRRRKPRPGKPLAVMFPADGRLLAETVVVAPEARALLESPGRPIVLLGVIEGCSLSPSPSPGGGGEQPPLTPALSHKGRGGLSDAIAPGLNEVGCFLPYSPLHHLLLEGFGGPLVATSGNISGEPVLTDNLEAQTRLAHIADAFLHHDRPIARPADDPVFRIIAGRPRPIRLGRGVAPLELELDRALPEPVLALGGHMKNAICLAWGRRAVISPHIGELDAARSLETMIRVAEDLQRLYQVRATRLLLDAHPGYGYRRWARGLGLPMAEIWHHRAHASALAWEFPAVKDWIVFAWDGVGLGEDGSLWGGEAFVGAPGAWRRAAALRPFKLPGGDKAGRQPWRSAAALWWEHAATSDILLPDSLTLALSSAERDGLPLLKQAWDRGLNSPVSSAVGRLFDAAAALIGVCPRASFEGEGPMRLEALASRHGASAVGENAPALPLVEDAAGTWRLDWSPLLPMLTDASLAEGERARLFHLAMADALVAQAARLREETGAVDVGFTGGVFQNRLLTELALPRLETAGFRVHLPERVPVNDAGVSFGQVIEYLAGDQGTR